MALVYCTKCGHRVSTTAPRCPGCGASGPAVVKAVIGANPANSVQTILTATRDEAANELQAPLTQRGGIKPASATLLKPATHSINFRAGCAGAIVMGFFTPWVAIGPISVSGYQVLSMAETFNEQALSLLLFGIPILGGLTVLAELSYLDVKESNRTTLARATGGLTIVGLLCVFISLAQQFPNDGGSVVQHVYEAMALGAYFTLGAAIVLRIHAR